MLNRSAIRILRIYQSYVSPLFMPSCRFYPSCSEYAVQTIDRYGLFRSLFRIFYRLSRCHPYCEGGHDPVK